MKMAIEIVDLPINSMVMFHRFRVQQEGLAAGGIQRTLPSSSFPALQFHRVIQVQLDTERQPEESTIKNQGLVNV